jgi:hypothetical protein
MPNFAASAAHAQIISEALSVFPAQTESLEYDNLAALRALPNYETLRQQFSGKPLEQAKATPAKLGIPEDQVTEMALGSTRGALYGLLGGAFSGSAAIKFAARKSILPLKLEDTHMFCPGAGTCIVFLEDWLAAFGSPGELKAMLEGRQGITASLGSNARFVRMMDNSDALAPVRGVASGNQFDSLISGGLREKTGMDLNWAQFSSSISLVGYSLTFEGKAHVRATLECKSSFAAAILKQILAALAQAGPKIADMPFQNMEVASSDATIDLKMDTILPSSLTEPRQ